MLNDRPLSRASRIAAALADQDELGSGKWQAGLVAIAIDSSPRGLLGEQVGGKVWKSGDNVLNAFIEPQWTVERSGNGQPQFTLLAGLNVTFGK